MTELTELYNARKQEIIEFLGVLKFLETKEQSNDEDGNSFEMFFNSDIIIKQKCDEDHAEFDKFFNSNGGIKLTYQSFTNIMKSNLSLMIYNLIEFTISGLIQKIYDTIKSEDLSYTDVNEYIRKLWRKAMLKSINDPNFKFSTFFDKNEEIINKIIDRTAIDLHYRDTVRGGNLDGEYICDILKCHGIATNTHSKNYRPDILGKIKKSRNDLAHGSVSFVEAMRDNSTKDIELDITTISNFLEEVIANVSEYLKVKSYKNIQH